MYVQEDFDTPIDNRIAALEDRLAELERDPEELRDIKAGLVKEAGLADINAEIRSTRSSINGIVTFYEQLAEDIRTNPNFSKSRVKSRLDFLDSKYRLQISPLTRILEALTTEKKTAEDAVNDEYSVELDIMNRQEDRAGIVRDEIQSVRDDAKDIRAEANEAYEFILENPSIFADMTPAQIKSEIAFIRRNGRLSDDAIASATQNAEAGLNFVSGTIDRRVAADGSLIISGINANTGQSETRVIVPPGTFRAAGADTGAGISATVSTQLATAGQMVNFLLADQLTDPDTGDPITDPVEKQQFIDATKREILLNVKSAQDRLIIDEFFNSIDLPTGFAALQAAAAAQDAGTIEDEGGFFSNVFRRLPFVK
jgi:hypothetical protein